MEPQNYKLISNKKRNRNKKMPVDYNLVAIKDICPIN